jgi:hypothetical protein
MSKRGILSVYWGDEQKLPIERLKNSLLKYHPNLPHKIIKIDAAEGDVSSLIEKTKIFDLSPFDETLFLDIDTVVMGNLDFGFNKASEYGLAICICEAPWARRYKNIFVGDEIEYNTGVIFFNKEAKIVFDEWKKLGSYVNSSIYGYSEAVGNYVSPANDQGSFALAIEKTKFNPFILPLNWNFRPIWHKSFFGPIKIWHDYTDPPSIIAELNSYYENKDSLIQYHQALK